MTRRVVAVHAHPDDESISMGATLARCAAGGAAVTLVTATLGEEGEVIGDELAGLVAGRADQLGGYRYTELRDACAALGLHDHRFLGGLGAWRDSGMAGTASADHPRAFCRARAGRPDHDRAVAQLRDVLDEVRPDVVLTYDSDGGYGHPDHLAAHEVAMTAATQAGVPRVLGVIRPATPVRAAFADYRPPAGYRTLSPGELEYLGDDDAVAVAVPVSFWGAARRAALAAHATQVELLPGGFALSNRIGQPLLDVEYFRLLAGEPVPALDEDAGEDRESAADGLPEATTDLFAGLP